MTMACCANQAVVVVALPATHMQCCKGWPCWASQLPALHLPPPFVWLDDELCWASWLTYMGPGKKPRWGWGGARQRLLAGPAVT